MLARLPARIGSGREAGGDREPRYGKQSDEGLLRSARLGARRRTGRPQLLGDAIAATFQRRGTAVPVEVPLGLSDEFAHDAAKRAQWKAFLGKNRLDAPTLDEVIGEVRHFVTEPLKLARQRKGAL